MIKKAFVDWAIAAILAYLDEHGDELLQQVIEWIKAMLDRSDEKVFAAALPPAGCEEFCAKQLDLYFAIRNEA